MNILSVVRMSRQTKNYEVPKDPCFIPSFQHQKYYGVLTLAGCQTPMKATLSVSSATGEGKENTVKGS